MIKLSVEVLMELEERGFVAEEAILYASHDECMLEAEGLVRFLEGLKFLDFDEDPYDSFTRDNLDLEEGLDYVFDEEPDLNLLREEELDFLLEEDLGPRAYLSEGIDQLISLIEEAEEEEDLSSYLYEVLI